jgi:hypothetical protein
MKKLIIFSFIVSAFLVSCNEPDFVDNDQQVGISKVTYYPTVTLQGDAYMYVAKGGTFTDPGATAEAGGATVPVTTSGTVNTSTVGVYVLTYTATNTDGFSASGNRWVAVYDTDAGAAANNYAGNYARTTNGSVAVWTKVAPGVYQVFNPGGAPGTNLTLIAFNPTGNIINVPPQVANDGGVYKCTNAAGGADITYNAGPPASYAWKVINPGYGTSTRTFIKQ